MNHVKVVISSKTIILTLAILFLLVILYQIKDVLLLLFAAFIISSALFPTVDWLSRKMSRPLAVSVIFAVGIAVILLLFIPFFMVYFGMI